MKSIIWRIALILALTLVFFISYVIYIGGGDFSVIKSFIASSIQSRGFYQTLYHFCLGAYEEEMTYRAPLLFLFLFSIPARLEKVRELAAWVLLVILNYYWTTLIHDQYPPIYQAIIFFGGLVNGSCIIYFKNKIFGLFAAIILHSAVNVTVISLVYYFLM